ncbi:tetratricopeptide repeat protein [Rhodoferax sp. OV413]|uniref:YfgM family protein n=1 Tax=Rhodoferax sp. OV413 TaxID=1855285 RepID=UPI0025D6F71C|nr:tetratricopeptide repeat protein [Rhodoferax sp. OV413]
MANHLDLEEQEQLDQLKHFWKRYGNLITWLLIAVLGSLAAWNGYQWWNKRQAEQASAMFDEVERVISGGDVVAAERAFSDMKQRFPSTVYAQQAGLTLARVAYISGKPEVAQNALAWVAESSADAGLAAVAKIRHAGLLLESKSFESAMKLLEGSFPAEFAGLVADKKGDAMLAQNKPEQAIAFFREAYKQLPEREQYRRLVEVKLASLGVAASAN